MSATPHQKSSAGDRRAGLEAELTDAVRFLAAEELELLVIIATRLLAGQRCYGPFNLARDRRDFRREALEEACDLAVYLAADIFRRRPRRAGSATTRGRSRRREAGRPIPACLASLGLDATATRRDVQRAYRRAVRRAHPDHGGSAEAFRAVQAPTKRR
jgi:hypothetical protein